MNGLIEVGDGFFNFVFDIAFLSPLDKSFAWSGEYNFWILFMASVWAGLES